MRVDALVVGQGLAGSLLARCLSEAGSVAVVDPGRPNASQVAAGLMTPLTGRKFRLTPEYPRLYSRACEAYAPLDVLHPVLVYRMFVDAEQRAQGLARAGQPDCAPFIDRIVEASGGLGPDLTDTQGGVLMRGAWVDLPRLLDETKGWLGERLICAEANPAEMVDGPEGVRWRHITARQVIWCDGWRAQSAGGLWADLPWQPAKGEALDILSDAPQTRHVLNREGWALPLGKGRWRTGTNWDWEVQDEQPTPAQREKLVGRFRGYFAAAPAAEVTRHVAGVRPCTPDNRPCVGRHPLRPRHHLLNGLGPRGTVWVPTAIDHLTALLRDNTPVPAELSPERFARG